MSENNIVVTIISDSAEHELEMPEQFDTSQRMKFDGVEIPSGQLYELLANGVSIESDQFACAAMEAAVYRTDRKVYFILTDDPQDPKNIEEHSVVDATVIERRVCEDARVRPLSVGTYVKFESRPTPENMALVASWLKNKGLGVMGVKDDLLLVAAEGLCQKMRAHLGVDADYQDNRHILTRIAVILQRPGGYKQTIDGLPSRLFGEEDGDGTIAILDEVDAPRQVTAAYYDQGGTLMGVAKGVIRPPLHLDDGQSEEVGLCRDLQFGKKLTEIPARIDFSQVRTIGRERASLNLQAIMFNYKNPDWVIADANEGLSEESMLDMLPKEEREKVEAGLPAALFMRKYSPWTWFTKFPVKGFRGLAVASHLVDRGSICINEAGKRELYKQGALGADRELPLSLSVHRDPAVSNANSTHSYLVQGMINSELDYDCGGYPIVAFNPADDHWKKAGGDFDGDMCVVFVDRHSRKPYEQPESNLRKHTNEPPVKIRGVAHDMATVQEMMHNYAPYLGPSVVSCMRLAESGALTPELARWGAVCTQGAVDAKKHPVNTELGIEMYDTLVEKVKEQEGDDGFFVDWLMQLRRARGEDGKANAWQDLGLYLNTHADDSRLMTELYRRWELLNGIYKAFGILEGSRAVIPENMRNTARAITMDSQIAISNTRELAQEYRIAMRASAGASSDDRYAARDGVALARANVRLALSQGSITPASLLGYGPHRLAAELLTAEELGEIVDTVDTLKVCLVGTEWTNCTLKASELKLIPSTESFTISKLAQIGDREVRLNVVRVNRGSVTAIVTI